MKSAIIITTQPLNLDLTAELYRDIGLTEIHSGTRLVVQGDWGWFGIDTDGDLYNEFDCRERAIIRRFIQEPIFAQLEYSTAHAANMAISILPTEPMTLIDNDHGMIRPIGQVHALIDARLP